MLSHEACTSMEENKYSDDFDTEFSMDDIYDCLTDVNEKEEKGTFDWKRASIDEMEAEEFSKLKCPPIVTERTINTIASSVPHKFFKDNFVDNSLRSVVNNTEPSDEYKSNVENNLNFPQTKQVGFLWEDSSEPKISPQVITIDDPFENKSEGPSRANLRATCDAIGGTYNQNNDTNADYKGMRRIKRKNKSSNIDLIRFDDDEQSGVVGSLPSGKFLKEVQKKRLDKDKHHLTKKDKPQIICSKKPKDKFVTINTLSFINYLSPDAPCMQLGNPNATKKLLISVAIHGDEPCGMIGFNELLQEGFFSCLPSWASVTGLVGNPAAVRKKQRFIEHNLNRMIRDDLFRKQAYEAERARVVAHAIDKCDVLLDLHSCSAKSPAHALPKDDIASIELASKLPVGYVIKYLAHTTKGRATTLDWAQKKNKIGVCVECGQHTERETIENAKNCIKTFVYLQCGMEERVEALNFTPPVVLNSRENEPVRKGFRFTRKVSAFEKVPFGEIIAIDDFGTIKSKYPEGTYIVMPTRNPVLGEEAFFYAEISRRSND